MSLEKGKILRDAYRPNFWRCSGLLSEEAMTRHGVAPAPFEEIGRR